MKPHCRRCNMPLAFDRERQRKLCDICAHGGASIYPESRYERDENECGDRT